MSEGVAAMLLESARHAPVLHPAPGGLAGELADDLSPLVSLVLYLCSQAAEVRPVGGGDRRPARPQPVRIKRGLRLFAPERPTVWGVAYRLGTALRRGMVEAQASGTSEGHASPRPHIRRAHWHSYWVGQRDRPGSRSVVLRWLPPISVNVQDFDALTPTVRPVCEK